MGLQGSEGGSSHTQVSWSFPTRVLPLHLDPGDLSTGESGKWIFLKRLDAANAGRGALCGRCVPTGCSLNGTLEPRSSAGGTPHAVPRTKYLIFLPGLEKFSAKSVSSPSLQDQRAF